MNIIAGKEKFWASLLAGGFVAAVSTIAQAVAGAIGVIDPPDKLAIAQAIDGGVVALASALAAYLATNSTPTNISVPAEPVEAPTHPEGY